MNSLKTYQPNEPVIFVHIPKCAGTSFIRLLRRWYRDGYRHPYQDESQDIMLPRVQTRTPGGHWDPTIRVIHAHWDHGRAYGLPYYCPDVTQYFTIVRDPFEMIVSMYFFVKGRSARGEFRFRGETVDLRQRYPTVNHYLDEEQPWLNNHLPVDLTLEDLPAGIARRFVYVGRFDRLQTSVDHLAFVLGMRRQVLPQHNVSEYDEPIPESRRAEIYQRYPLMKGLFDHAETTYLVPGFKHSKIEPALPELQQGRRAGPKSRPTLSRDPQVISGTERGHSSAKWWRLWLRGRS